MQYEFKCPYCNKVLVTGHPMVKDLTCNCSKTFTFFNVEYREYELGIVVTNSNIEVLDRFKLNSSIGLANKIKWRNKIEKRRRVV